MSRVFPPSALLSRYIAFWSIAWMLAAFSNIAFCSNEKMNMKDFYTDPRMLALIKAAESNNMNNLKLLVNNGINPNNFGNEGMTPLLWVLGHQNKKALKALLSVGADPNLQFSGKESPMSMAAGAKDANFLKILLDGGGDPNSKNRLGKPALFVAIGQVRLDNIKLLLDYGADINATDRTGTTPVMYAAILNQYHIVHFLLENGADYAHLADGNISLALYVQSGKVNPQLEVYKWRKKVIIMLEEKGIKFPVPNPSEMQKPGNER